jgi:hypothetical protein
VIRLRWAVGDPAAWKLANQYGYIIERYTILRDGKINAAPEKIQLTPSPLKAQPEETWTSIVENNDNAAIVAQGLFGESFAAEGGDGKVAKIVNETTELTQRFAFSLMAADRDFTVACKAGWGWIDSTAKAGEKYLYRVYTAVPREKMVIDTGLLYIGQMDYVPLPQPKELMGKYGDRTVMLSWDCKLLKDTYTSYFIERSDDGVHFEKISNLPIAVFTQKEDNPPSRMYYADTLKDNAVKQYYRIRGLTAFGETGPPSKVVNGEGEEALPGSPVIKDADVINDSTALIKWEFPQEAEHLADHFELNRTDNSAKENSYQTVNTHIPASSREVTFFPLQPSNYFTVTVVDKQGNKRTSFPYFVQPVDSIPPAVPAGLKGVIDSLGNVTLTWNANTEPDLLGYMVLKSNLKNEEASILNSKPFPQNTYREKLGLNTLNSKVYYAVIALDKRMNRSKPCAFVELTKPDTIPPTPPSFKDYTVTDGGKVVLIWNGSSSDDVKMQKLFRKNANDSKAAWENIQNFTDVTVSTYTDDGVSPGETVCYVMTAVDSSNNVSRFSPQITVSVIDNRKIAAVKSLKADMDRDTKTVTVSWKFDNPDVVEYTVYRAVNKAPFTTWSVIKSPQTAIEDKNLSVGNTYHYGVKATLKNGKMSEWKEVKVEY